jgi:hypothetical protein
MFGTTRVTELEPLRIWYNRPGVLVATLRRKHEKERQRYSSYCNDPSNSSMRKLGRTFFPSESLSKFTSAKPSWVVHSPRSRTLTSLDRTGKCLFRVHKVTRSTGRSSHAQNSLSQHVFPFIELLGAFKKASKASYLGTGSSRCCCMAASSAYTHHFGREHALATIGKQRLG